jgi:endo-beta-N-acetylglucosaminidase D
MCYSSNIVSVQINIESRVPKTQVPNMLHFVQALRGALRRALPPPSPALAVWYDACDINGRVAHQSTLNKYNLPFFAVRRFDRALV